jgi:hypothetical protein
MPKSLRASHIQVVVLMAVLKAILVAILLAALMISVLPLAGPPSGNDPASLFIVRGRTLPDNASGLQLRPDTGVVGNVSIGPVRPVCFAPENGTSTVPSPSTSTQVVVTSQSGERTSIPVSWSIWGGCVLSGSFKAELVRGDYSLTLSYCSQDPRSAGCPGSPWFQMCTIPTTVHVERGRLTPVQIGIETGIR